jgi:hypothetical protein
MAEDWPKIKARHYARVAVDGDHRARGRVRTGKEREIYHAISQQDYIAIVAALSDSRIPIVRQIPSGAGELYLGISSGARRAGRRCARVLPPRIHGGDRFCRSRRACAGVCRLLSTCPRGATRRRRLVRDKLVPSHLPEIARVDDLTYCSVLY